MNLKEALSILGTKPPKLTKKMTQAEVDKRVQEWKDEELPKILKGRQKETHPDKGGDGKIFAQLENAVEVVRKKLHLKAYKPPPAEVKKCRSCGARRTPLDAIHCHECGAKYELEAPRTRCPVCDVGRNPGTAKFCYNCGYDYKVPDSFIELMVTMGFTAEDIHALTLDGSVSRWKRMPAFSQSLRSDMKLALAKRKLARGDNSGMADIWKGLRR